MASEAEYDVSEPLRPGIRAGAFALAHGASKPRTVRWSWRRCAAQLRSWLRASLPFAAPVVAMARPVEPEMTSHADPDPPLAAPQSGSGFGAREPPPEKPKATPPEGVAVQRYGNADLLELLGDEPATSALQAGEILFKEGDPGTTMYLVRSGVLRIRSGSVVYEDVAAGGIVGEMGLVEKHMPRSATVYALQPTELVEIDEDKFARLVERVPSFAITVMRVLSRRLRHMDRRYRLEDSA